MGAPGTKTRVWKWFHEYGFYPVDGGKYEEYEGEEEQTIHRFAHTDHALSIYVEWED